MRHRGRKRSTERENISKQEHSEPGSRARLWRRLQGGRPAVSSTEMTAGLHVPIVNELLERNRENEFVRTQDEGTPFYLSSQEEQVLDTQDGSIERREGSVSRIIELEELSAKEEKQQVMLF